MNKYLGKGSFARVYKATNIDSGRTVALKVIDIDELNSKYQQLGMADKVQKYLVSE